MSGVRKGVSGLGEVGFLGRDGVDGREKGVSCRLAREYKYW